MQEKKQKGKVSPQVDYMGTSYTFRLHDGMYIHITFYSTLSRFCHGKGDLAVSFKS